MAASLIKKHQTRLLFPLATQVHFAQIAWLPSETEEIVNNKTCLTGLNHLSECLEKGEGRAVHCLQQRLCRKLLAEHVNCLVRFQKSSYRCEYTYNDLVDCYHESSQLALELSDQGFK